MAENNILNNEKLQNNKEVNLDSHKKEKLEPIEIVNPFIHADLKWDQSDSFEKIRTIIFTVLLLPIRVICISLFLFLSWLLALVALHGVTREELMTKPLYGWRRIVKFVISKIAVLMYLMGGIVIAFKGKLAKRSLAPIFVVAPHSSFLDAILIYVTNMSSPLVRNEDRNLGKLIDLAQPIYVCREDHESRTKTIQDIVNRASSGEDWPQILVFPEGTCTNRTSLIQFKPGAFYPGVPVQPVLIRYPNKIDTVTWTWQGPEVITLLWRTLTQLHTFCEIEYLPVYVPSEEEKKHPKLYAQNVQQLMAKALSIPLSDYTFDDCKLMEYAKKCKMFFAAHIADVNKLRAQIGIAQKNIEENIVKNNFNGTEEYFYHFEKFVQKLQIPGDSPVSLTLFNLFRTESEDVIDFKEYLLHTLFLIKLSEPKIELVRVLFMLYGDNGKIGRNSLHKILKHVITVSPEKIDQLFLSIDKNCKGFILFDEFNEAVKELPEYSKLYAPNRNFRPQSR